MIAHTFVILAILLGTIFIGTPVAFGLGFSAVMLIVVFLDSSQLMQMGSIAFSQGTSMNQLVAPLFILMAEALAQGNIASDIFTVLSRWLRRIDGGLALSTMLASTLFAALCGSSPATAAAMGRVSVTEMKLRGYREDFAVGVVAAGGTLGIMIPPSISLVIFGIITENSITRLFMAGFLPGLLISVLLCFFILVRVKLNPELIGKYQNKDILWRDEKKSLTQKTNQSTQIWCKNNFIKDMQRIVPPILLIFIVMGSLYTGMTTPTEAAGFGAIGALLLVIIMGRMTKTGFINIMTASARTSSMILFLIIGGMALSYVVCHLGLAQTISNLIISSGLNRWIIMVLIYLLWVFLGCLMDPLSMIVLTVPFIYPTLLELKFDPIWLGIVSTLCVEIGMITPPVGLNLFVLKATSDVSMEKIMTGALPFVLVLLTGLLIVSIFPQTCLYLPSIM